MACVDMVRSVDVVPLDVREPAAEYDDEAKLGGSHRHRQGCI